MAGWILQRQLNSKRTWNTRKFYQTHIWTQISSEKRPWEQAQCSLARAPGLRHADKTIRSHHLRPGHRVLMRVVVWIPVTKTVHVIVWVHLGSFVRHGDLPELGQPGRAGRDGTSAVEMFSLWSAAMLHDLFILGALILKPYFHLKRENAHNCHCG